MTDKRDKKPPEETKTELGFVPGDVQQPSAPEEREGPVLEVHLPDDTDTSPDLLDDTATSLDPEEPADLPIELDAPAPSDAPLVDLPDDATRTDLLTGPLDRRVHDPATGDESRMLEVRMDPKAAEDTATAPSDGTDETPTETGIAHGQTLTEFGVLEQAAPPQDGKSEEGDAGTRDPGTDTAAPTDTEHIGKGVSGLKALARIADETQTAIIDPTQTRWDPEGDTGDLADRVGHDDDTVDLSYVGSNDETKDLSHAPVPGFSHDGATIHVDDDVTTGSAPSESRNEPDFEVHRIEVPAAAFVDTFYERREDREREERRGRSPVRRSWRDRLERARPTPWRDVALWAAGRLDPRPWWKHLKDLRRRKQDEEPTNQQVAKDAANSILSWVASVVKPRAEVSAEHNKEWWRRTTIEILALFLIVVPVEWSVNGSVGSFGAHPHPYWLIVLPMAAARGVVAGLLAAAVAGVLFALGALTALNEKAPTLLEDVFEFEHMLEPILFFVVAFFTGELHDEMASRYRKLHRRHDDVQDRNQSLRQERDVLRDANRELEKRIVDASVQFGNLIITAERIESSGRAEVFEIALELVEEHCGAGASILLRLEDGSLDYLCHRGWDDDELSDRLAIARESGLVQRAIGEGHIVNGFEEGETPPATGPLVVAPLFDSSGLIKALLCLDEVPETRLNPSTITIFLGIANWISSVLTRLARNDDAKRLADTPRPAMSGALWLGSSDDLGERLRLEVERCARYGVPTSFLAIQLSTITDMTSEGMDKADRFIAAHFTTGLRPSDNVYRFGYPGCYLLVLAGTSVSGAEVVRNRLLRRIDYAGSTEVGPVEIFASGPDAEAPDLLSLVDRVADRLRKNSVQALEGGCPITVPTRSQAHDSHALARRLHMETSLSQRCNLDLHVIAIRPHLASPDAIHTLARHLADVGTTLLRATDGIYHVSSDCMAIVMPSTRGPEAASLAHRIVQALRERDTASLYGDVETKVIGLGPENPDVHAMLIALGFQFTPELSS